MSLTAIIISLQHFCLFKKLFFFWELSLPQPLLLLQKLSCFFTVTLTTGDWFSSGHLTRTGPIRVLPRKFGFEKRNSVPPGSLNRGPVNSGANCCHSLISKKCNLALKNSNKEDTKRSRRQESERGKCLVSPQLYNF